MGLFGGDKKNQSIPVVDHSAAAPVNGYDPGASLDDTPQQVDNSAAAADPTAGFGAASAPPMSGDGYIMTDPPADQADHAPTPAYPIEDTADSEPSVPPDAVSEAPESPAEPEQPIVEPEPTPQADLAEPELQPQSAEEAAVEPTPAEPVPVSVTSASGVDHQDLDAIKQQALTALSPLVGHLDQTPEEKFRTTMMMIQAADDRSLIPAAHEAAQAIVDEKARAQALLDIVNEINYFTQKSN